MGYVLNMPGCLVRGTEYAINFMEMRLAPNLVVTYTNKQYGNFIEFSVTDPLTHYTLYGRYDFKHVVIDENNSHIKFETDEFNEYFESMINASNPIDLLHVIIMTYNIIINNIDRR